MLDGTKARLVAAAALAADGRRDDAVAQLRRATEVAARSGAGKFHDQAAQALRALGERVAPLTGARAGTSGEVALTEREQAITELVAQGQSNKQVAASLFLSEKTVEKHLTRVFGKLGVRSRAELAATFARRD